MTDTSKATARPWKIEGLDNGPGESIVIGALDGRLTVAEVHDHSDTSTVHTHEEAEANAALIVLAVNQERRLAEAVELLERVKDSPSIRGSAWESDLRGLLARVEGIK